MKNLGPRPKPEMIRFDRDCFEVVGTEVIYYVSQSALQGGPARFTSRDEAYAFAKKRNRAVTECVEPVSRRVRWF